MTDRSTLRIIRVVSLILVGAAGACATPGASGPVAIPPPAVDPEDTDPPVTADDIEILERAERALESEAVWDRADDRLCRPTDTTISLFCALEAASVAVLGSYDHRRAALQEVRFVIEHRGKPYEHRLMDFNNDPATTFADLKQVLRTAIDLVRQRVAGAKPRP